MASIPSSDDEGPYEIYRESKLGESLLDTLHELVSDNHIPAHIAVKIMANFDRIVAEVIAASPLDCNVSISGHLESYNEVYPAYKLNVTNAVVKMGPGWTSRERSYWSAVNVDRLEILTYKAKKETKQSNQKWTA